MPAQWTITSSGWADDEICTDGNCADLDGSLVVNRDEDAEECIGTLEVESICTGPVTVTVELHGDQDCSTGATYTMTVSFHWTAGGTTTYEKTGIATGQNCVDVEHNLTLVSSGGPCDVPASILVEGAT